MAVHGTAQSNRFHATREWNQILLGVSGEYYFMLHRRNRKYVQRFVLSADSHAFAHISDCVSFLYLFIRYQSATRTMDYGIQRKLEENGKQPQAGVPIKLSVQHILGALFLLLFGNCFATIAFIVEMLLNTFKRNKMKVRSQP